MGSIIYQDTHKNRHISAVRHALSMAMGAIGQVCLIPGTYQEIPIITDLHRRVLCTYDHVKDLYRRTDKR